MSNFSLLTLVYDSRRAARRYDASRKLIFGAPQLVISGLMLLTAVFVCSWMAATTTYLWFSIGWFLAGASLSVQVLGLPKKSGISRLQQGVGDVLFAIPQCFNLLMFHSSRLRRNFW